MQSALRICANRRPCAEMSFGESGHACFAVPVDAIPKNLRKNLVVAPAVDHCPPDPERVVAGIIDPVIDREQGDITRFIRQLDHRVIVVAARPGKARYGTGRPSFSASTRRDSVSSQRTWSGPLPGVRQFIQSSKVSADFHGWVMVCE